MDSYSSNYGSFNSSSYLDYSLFKEPDLQKQIMSLDDEVQVSENVSNLLFI